MIFMVCIEYTRPCDGKHERDWPSVESLFKLDFHNEVDRETFAALQVELEKSGDRNGRITLELP